MRCAYHINKDEYYIELIATYINVITDNYRINKKFYYSHSQTKWFKENLLIFFS